MKYILPRVAGYCFSVSLKYTENTPVLCDHLENCLIQFYRLLR